jgi:hypothetical protein
MAFTYDLTTDRGATRLRLSDANANAYVFEDAEIDYFLTLGGSVKAAVIEGVKVLMMDKARRVKRATVMGLTIDDTAQVQGLKDMLKVLGGDLPQVTISMPALLPMDVGYDEDSP